MPRKKEALSNAERQRRFRQKMLVSPTKHTLYLAKERQRWQERKLKKKVKGVDDLTERERRKKRRYWVKAKRESRKREKVLMHAISPPDTPRDTEVPAIPGSGNSLGSSRKHLGRRRVRKDRAACYRELFKLKVKLTLANRHAEKYRKRYSRLVKAHVSPRKQAANMMKPANKKREVFRALVFHNSFMAALKARYADAKSHGDKQLLKNVLASKLIRKYRLKQHIRQQTGIKLGTGESNANQLRRRHCTALSDRFKMAIREFLERDDNSRVTTGKADTISRHGEKRQRRVLQDTLQNLHMKYCMEFPERNVSYSLFCRLRPFHVVPPTARDRQTCLCKLHDNCNLMYDKLKHLKILKGLKSVDDCISLICCDQRRDECYLRQCEDCKEQLLMTSDDETETVWYQWTSTTEEVTIQDKQKKVRKVVKQQQHGTVKQLVQNFNEALMKLSGHALRIRKQFSALKQLRTTAGGDTAIIVVDFSENYNCKLAREIQSTHFGASQVQATLHTGKFGIFTDTDRLQTYNKH